MVKIDFYDIFFAAQVGAIVLFTAAVMTGVSYSVYCFAKRLLKGK